MLLLPLARFGRAISCHSLILLLPLAGGGGRGGGELRCRREGKGGGENLLLMKGKDDLFARRRWGLWESGDQLFGESPDCRDLRGDELDLRHFVGVS